MTWRLLALCCGLALSASSTLAFAAGDIGDREMAARYTAAAAAGDNRAQFYLGALYSTGVGVAQSDGEAFGWVARAAQQGNSQAMLVLGGLLAIGRGAPKDNVAAYKWAYIVSQGSRIAEYKNGAAQLLSLLETRMSPAEIDRAKSDAVAFRSTPTPSSLTPASRTRATETAISPIPPVPPSPIPPPPPATASPLATAVKPTPAPAPNTRDTNDRDLPKSRNSDFDRLLDNVPSSIRRRYGF
jgi:hypothetical protein